MQNLIDSGNHPELKKVEEADFDKCLEFLDRDMSDSRFAMWLSKDSNLKNAEVIVLFEEEFFAKVRGREKTMIHNEALGMDRKFAFERDCCVSLSKKDITSISVYRPPICNCEKEPEPHQPDYWELQVSTAGGDYTTTVNDREIAYELCENIRDWRFGKGIFRKTFKEKFINFFKKLF